MQTKNLTGYNYTEVTIIKITKRFKSIKKSNLIASLIILFILFITSSIVINFFEILNSVSSRNSLVVAFKSDINTISETALIIENQRNIKNKAQINSFGSNGKLISPKELTPELTSALTKSLSSEEISKLKITELDIDAFQSQFRELHFNLSSLDCNLKHYVVITEGKYAGTILYNGSLKFIDDKNKRYFGLDLSL